MIIIVRQLSDHEVRWGIQNWDDYYELQAGRGMPPLAEYSITSRRETLKMYANQYGDFEATQVPLLFRLKPGEYEIKPSS
jgi:hypothetical protein